MASIFPESRAGRHWNYHKEDNKIEYYTGEGASQLVIVVVDQNERLRVSPEEVSNRHISDFLKQLELLDLIEIEYHYGGNIGKIRNTQHQPLENNSLGRSDF